MIDSIYPEPNTSPALWTSWDREHPLPNYCIDLIVFYYCAAAINITIDVIVALIPIPELWRLTMSWKKKLMLCAIFSVGFVYALLLYTRDLERHTS